MLFYLLFIISITFSSASITSVTYSDSNCASNSGIGLYYDARESISCVASTCTPVGDGNYYEIRCNEALSLLDNSDLIIVNYYDSMESCANETAVLAYGGLLGHNAVNINKQFNGGWVSVQFMTTDTMQFTKCILSERPECTTLFVHSYCSAAPNLEVGSYWRYLTPSPTTVDTPSLSPTSPSNASDEGPSDPLPPTETLLPFEAPAVVEAPTDSTPTATPGQQDVVRCNCADLSNCRCNMSCQMVDDVVTCSLG